MVLCLKLNVMSVVCATYSHKAESVAEVLESLSSTVQSW